MLERDDFTKRYNNPSAWDPKNPMVQFITKALGDHTSTLHERLKPGMPVTVEGPYGCFTFDDTHSDYVSMVAQLPPTTSLTSDPRVLEAVAAAVGSAPQGREAPNRDGC